MNKTLKEIYEKTNSGRKWMKVLNNLKMEVESIKNTQTEGILEVQILKIKYELQSQASPKEYKR